MSDSAGGNDGAAGRGRTPPPETSRLRSIAARAVEVVGGLPAVRTLRATLAVYDGAGGGVMAGGLAYSALIALVPGLLLMASAIGLLVTDRTTQDRIVEAIAMALPPLESVVRIALESVAAGAVPTSILAFIGLLWGSSRFYSALDYAFSKVFHEERARNEVIRTARGILVTVLFVAIPAVALVAGSIASWALDLAPAGFEIRGLARTAWQLASPLGSLVIFVALVSAVYRFVPTQRVPVRAFLRPAIVVGLVLAAFTQLFTFIAPRMVGFAALYGTFVALFAILAWLSIGFNVLLLGASWTRVRALAMASGDAPPAVDVDDGTGRGATSRPRVDQP